MSAQKIETWTKTGYELLGQEGVEGIKIERLARILHLNKSGFYYYFGTMECYCKSLIQYHVRQARIVAMEIGGCDNIDPDLLLLIVKHKTFFLVESQLLVKGRLHGGDDPDEAGRIINAELLLLWRKTRALQEDPAIFLASLNIIRHFFYARIKADNVDYAFLHSLASEIKDVLDMVIMNKHPVPGSKPIL